MGYFEDSIKRAGSVAVDVETTGLNFLTDVLLSISLSTGEHTIVIPIYHKDIHWTYEELEDAKGRSDEIYTDAVARLYRASKES